MAGTSLVPPEQSRSPNRAATGARACKAKAKPQLPRCQKTLRDVLSREEIDRMEAAVPTERDKLIIRLFGDCGLRLTELTELTSSDIVRTSGRQAVLRVRGKGDRMRDVPLPPLTLRRVERLAGRGSADHDSDRLFLSLRRGPTGQFAPLTSSGVHQVVKDAAARAGIAREVHAHLLRHSWMTELARQGLSPFQLSIIAGTSLQVIMDHYIHLTRHDAFDAMIKALAPLRA